MAEKLHIKDKLIIIFLAIFIFINYGYVLTEDNSFILLLKTIPDKCKIYVDGLYKGISPIRLKLSQGQHKILIKPQVNGYKEKTIKINAVPKENKELEIKLDNIIIFYFKKGYFFYKKRYISKSIQYLEKSLEYDPAFKDSIYLLGKLYFMKKDYKKSLFYFKKLQNSKDNYFVLFYIANIYYIEKKFNKSAFYYYKTLKKFYPYNQLEYNEQKTKQNSKNNEEKFLYAIKEFRQKNYLKSCKIFKILSEDILKNLKYESFLSYKEE